MKVYKFGGASVKDADSVRNVLRVIQHHQDDHLLVVISAMGKTTNAMEAVVNAYFEKGDAWEKALKEVKVYHRDIMYDLFGDYMHAIFQTAEKIYDYIERFLAQEDLDNYDYIYDQIVPAGELLSTKIVSAYLQAEKVPNEWLDARKLVLTDNRYRSSKVDWEATEAKVTEVLAGFKGKKKKHKLAITQGFIGGGEHNRMTTLGREGSDFTAAIFASVMNASEVTIWKDVPGVLNADPKWFNNTEKLDNISYKEAIELAYYGATVIHPKTIKPLRNKKIPLYVSSFLDHQEKGTVIDENASGDGLVPSYIFKADQVLVSIASRDFSFMADEKIGDLFHYFAKHRVRINAMQNSAISFSASVDNDASKIKTLMDDLGEDYSILYNEGLELLTIRHYDNKTVEELLRGRDVLLEQKSRQTIRVLMKNAVN